MQHDVVFTLTGPIAQNSRALKQLDALEALGLHVLALGIGQPAEEHRGERIIIRTLPRPAGTGPRFFLRVHRLFEATLSGLDACVFHASDLYGLPACVRRAKRTRARAVFDARECYTHVAATAGRPWVSWFWKQVEGRYIKLADAVFTVSPSISNYLAGQYGISEPAVLYNAPPVQSVSKTNLLREHFNLPDSRPIILHQGQIQHARGCFILADAMRDVPDAALVFMGGGPLKPALMEHVRTSNLTGRVFFLDHVPPHTLLAFTASADIGVTLLEDTCLNHRFALPNKLFEYLMAGLPVLGSDLPEIRRVVAEHNVGLVVDPGQAGAVAEALNTMLEDQAQRQTWITNAPQVFETFGWESAYVIFTTTYRNLLEDTT